MPALFFTENEQSPRTLLKNTSLVNLSSPATLPCCCFLVLKLWLTLCDPMDCSLPDSLCPWDFPGENTGVGYHFPLQGIVPQQGCNLHPPALAGGVFTPEPPQAPSSTTGEYGEAHKAQSE